MSEVSLWKEIDSLCEERDRLRAKAVPAGFTAIEDIIADSKSNPRKRAALERARAKISAQLKKADGETEVG